MKLNWGLFTKVLFHFTSPLQVRHKIFELRPVIHWLPWESLRIFPYWFWGRKPTHLMSEPIPQSKTVSELESDFLGWNSHSSSWECKLGLTKNHFQIWFWCTKPLYQRIASPRFHCVSCKPRTSPSLRHGYVSTDRQQSWDHCWGLSFLLACCSWVRTTLTYRAVHTSGCSPRWLAGNHAQVTLSACLF